MFKYYNPLLSKNGDVLPGRYVRLFTAGGAEVDLFADASGTPIITESGVANAAVSDTLGMVRFYVANGTYDLRIYDEGDNFVSAEVGVPMLDAGGVYDDLASTDAEKGAALVKFSSGDTVEDLASDAAGKGASLVKMESGETAEDAILARPTTAALASSTGGEMVGTSRDNTVDAELTWARAATPASINEFYDALNGAAAERMALEAAAATGSAVAWRGTLTMDQAPNLPAHTTLIGEGATSDNGTRGNTCIVRGFAGTGPLLLLGNDMTLRNIDIDGDNQGTGDNIQIIGERVTLDNVSTRKAGRHGCWIGDLNNSTMNANSWAFYAFKSIYNAGAGLYIHQTNGNTSATWPIGAADVNAGSLFGGDLRSNGGHGLHIGNAVDNKFYGLSVQDNVGSNIYLDDYARGNCFFSPYSEGGGSPDTFVALSSGNLMLGTSSVAPASISDSGTGNVFMRHDALLKEQVFSGRVGIAPVYLSGEGGHLDLYNDELDLAAQLFGEKTGVGSQGKGVATAKRNGNTPLDIFEWVDGVGINILSGGLRVAGTKVIGAQQTAIANAAGGDEVAKINAILAALRAHGLIAT